MNTFDSLWRDSINEWLAPKGLKDLVLYHYTTSPGLLGILSSGILRGSNALFLNDPREIRYGYEICRSVIEEQLAFRHSEPETTLLKRLGELISDDPAPSDVYVTSFTELKDDLGQWRAYGSEGRYSLGFRAAQFSERDILRFPRPVDYDPVSQKARVRTMIELACADVAKATAGDGWRMTANAWTYLRMLIMLFKDPAFVAEKEWRAVARIDEDVGPNEVQFLVVGGTPRPYITMFEGSRSSRRLPIANVRVGDLSNGGRNVMAAGLMLQRFGYGDAALLKTDVPFVV